MKRTLLPLWLVVLAIALSACSLRGVPASPSAAPQSMAPGSESQVPTVASPSLSDSAPPLAESSPPASPVVAPFPASTERPAGGSASGTVITPVSAADPFDLLSQESMFGYLEDLTAIQPYSGWRNSGSEGEAEALDYVAGRLDDLAYLQSLGTEMEHQSFHVFLATELWETRLQVTVGGQQIEVPADGLRGPRDQVEQALRFDSDGVLNDSESNPQEVKGEVVFIRSSDRLKDVKRTEVRDRIVFLDYALIDRSLMDTQDAVVAVYDLLEKGPAGLVLVTRFSNAQGVSHGAFVADNSALNWVEADPMPPVLYVRLEDLAPAGIEGWEDLERIEAAHLTWDADVFSPGTSGNLVAHIPGTDPSRAIILGAHIDSPNVPGAMDDGSGSAILLEVARVLDQAQVQPPTDLYLAWFGSEELGLYGAYHFVSTHQELLDRTVAMLQIDCLTRPLDALDAEMRLVTWPYGRLGDPRMVWPETLAQASAERGVETVPFDIYSVYSDNSTFGGYDVPNADLIYEPVVTSNVSVHYAGHLHDPYDTVSLAREVGDVLEQMARVALAAALDMAREDVSLRVTPRPDRRALFVASHTEATHMTPAGFTDLGMALAMEGFDVDLIPHGQAVTSADLKDADLVFVLPVLDYPSLAGDPALYDDAWTQEEVDALKAYVADGGLLVLTNSRHRLKYGTQRMEPNEDWGDANALALQFGVTYQDGVVAAAHANVEADHPLVLGVEALESGEGNGVPLIVAEGVTSQGLARSDGDLVAALVDFGGGGGQVLALSDVGILTAGWSELPNLPFWQNLARYARTR